ncbi:MAG: transposase [Deltaproteobacteria bacterium]|nr:transposase [Deltaproteobacteria bacterium]
MARKPRVEFDGAFYHVIVRGNQRQRTFQDDRDRAAYLQRIEHYRQRYGFRLYAYVLMSNHVHLLLETKSVALSKIMQGIQASYTQSYNRRHRKVGHLFQGRYKAILCDRNAYLLELVRYLHLNPGRLREPEDPWRYRWSSHGAYLGKASPVKLDTQEILSQFGSRLDAARRAYLGFMEDGMTQGHEEKYYQTLDQRFLGDERFVREVAERSEAKEVEIKGKKVGFARLLQAVCTMRHVDSKVLLQPGRQRQWVALRAQLVYLAREWCGLTAKELAGRLNRDASMISRLYGWYQGHRDQHAEEKLFGELAK